MKKLVIILVAIFLSNFALAQYSRFNEAPKRNFTFQVAPSVFNYKDNVRYGYHLGVNFKEALNISYFSMRDYDFSKGIKDCGWYGFNIAYSIKLAGPVGIGPVVRFANINGTWEKPYYGAEVRYDLTESLKFAVEYGRANNETQVAEGFGMKLIWNIY